MPSHKPQDRRPKDPLKDLTVQRRKAQAPDRKRPKENPSSHPLTRLDHQPAVKSPKATLAHRPVQIPMAKLPSKNHKRVAPRDKAAAPMCRPSHLRRDRPARRSQVQSQDHQFKRAPPRAKVLKPAPRSRMALRPAKLQQFQAEDLKLRQQTRQPAGLTRKRHPKAAKIDQRSEARVNS